MIPVCLVMCSFMKGIVNASIDPCFVPTAKQSSGFHPSCVKHNGEPVSSFYMCGLRASYHRSMTCLPAKVKKGNSTCPDAAAMTTAVRCFPIPFPTAARNPPWFPSDELKTFRRVPISPETAVSSTFQTKQGSFAMSGTSFRTL